MTVETASPPMPSPAAGWDGPPRWLLLATGVIAGVCLVMAIAETNWWMHFLIDDGEYVSLAGLAFVTVAGLYLYRSGRLLVSLPLVFPWLLFPVITQGDQLIDNLSINWMRLITHVLLAALFAMPVAIVVLAAVLAIARRRRDVSAHWLTLVPGLRLVTQGRVREGGAVLAAALLVLEIWIAAHALGRLMIVTLVVMVVGVLVGGTAVSEEAARRVRDRLAGLSQRFALGVLLVGVVVSLGLFVGFKHRPGAYQGSPSYFMDPAQREHGFRIDVVPVGTLASTMPDEPDLVRQALTGYARVLERLVAGYHILDRNYTYDFHNHLFLRQTPLLADYRAVALSHTSAARQLYDRADAQGLRARSTLRDDDPLTALLADLGALTAFNVDRAPVLEDMSEDFERTPAGLQHAAHLYEGEGKVVTARLSDVLAKHGAVLSAPALSPVVGEFVTLSRTIADTYRHRIVGF